MKILVIGSGGREHAIVWALAKKHEVLCAPGNPGIADTARTFDIAASDLEGICQLAQQESVELVVVGPEAPLVAGLADLLREQGVAVFGPGKSGAQLEGSKAHCKDFFVRHGIPTGRSTTCTTLEQAREAIREMAGDVVIKADGLAAGKGVVVCDDVAQADAAAASILDGKFGEAGAQILVEERLRGRELSLMAITDGTSYKLLAAAEDHKALLDGDQGPNTGGMGAVSPAHWVSEELLVRARTEVFDPTVAGLRADGVDFRGVLYAGMMVADDGAIRMLEYNVRFGDPETQVVLTRLEDDLGALLFAAARGDLPAAPLRWSDDTTCAVILASAGYPEAAVKGKAISVGPEAEHCELFHAGTARVDDHLVTAGGRVLAVVGRGATLADARAKAYAGVAGVSFEGAQHRSDIGARESR